jgi:hypothetical protein
MQIWRQYIDMELILEQSAHVAPAIEHAHNLDRGDCAFVSVRSVR